MCTREETKQIIHDEIFKKDGLRDSLAKEIDRAINARIGKWLIGGGIVFIFMIAISWGSLSNDVANNTSAIEESLTIDQSALIILRLEQLENVVNKQSIIIEKFDERLRLNSK